MERASKYFASMIRYTLYCLKYDMIIYHYGCYDKNKENSSSQNSQSASHQSFSHSVIQSAPATHTTHEILACHLPRTLRCS